MASDPKRASLGRAQSAARRSRELPIASLASDVHLHVLGNGLRVLVREVYPSRVTSLSMWAHTGALDESDQNAGISHFLEHLVFKGRGLGEQGGVANEIQRLGGYINGFTSHEYTCFWSVFPGTRLKRALSLHAEAMFRPGMRAADVESERRVILQELRLYDDRPNSYCLHQLLDLAFGDHPYARPVLGRESTLRTLDETALAAHHRTHYQPQNVTLVMVGDLQIDTCLEWADQALGSLPTRTVPIRPVFPQPPKQRRERTLEGEIQGAHLQLGFIVPDLFSQDAFACDLLASILGRSRSSRLVQSLRERHQVAHSVQCHLFLGRGPGLFQVRTVLPDPGHFGRVEHLIHEELDCIARNGVTPAELEKARNLVESAYVFSQETVEGQARKLGHYDVMGDHRLAEDYVKRLWQVDSEALARVARNYLRPERAAVVAYGPRT